MKDSCKVTFQPDGLSVHVLRGTSILEAAGEAGIIIDTPCGGNGTCGKCRVKITEGVPEPNELEKEVFSADEIKNGLRLACQSKIGFDTVVTVFANSRFFEQKILTEDIGGVETGDRPGEGIGIAFDVGTTTVVGSLVDLETGKRLHVASRTNPQVAFGDDVVSRIGHAGTEEGLGTLRDAIRKCMNDIIAELCRKGGIDPSSVRGLSVAGNPTMGHLLLGIDPSPIAQAPYDPVIRDAVEKNACDIGLSINNDGTVYVMPNIAGFVGGDTVAVILSTGMFAHDSLQLAVDIGTNGEIVLGNRDGLICCSAAAGPAFEGARISQGMRAMPGAIEKIVIADDVMVNTIEGEPPRGICGSGLVDIVAELLRAGVIDQTGRMLRPEDIPGTVSEQIRQRIVDDNGEIGFVITLEEDGGRVVLTQRDVRQVQLAKGAIFAAIETLRDELGIEYDNISEILLAGAMANFIRRSNAKRIGLLPDIPSDRIRFVGNAALAGARMALISRSHRDQAEHIGRSARYIELANRTDFQTRFADAMLFP